MTTQVRGLMTAQVRGLMPTPVRGLMTTQVRELMTAQVRRHHPAMDMMLSDERANVNAHDIKGRTCLHWTGTYGMTRLAELLLCRADSHID